MTSIQKIAYLILWPGLRVQMDVSGTLHTSIRKLGSSFGETYHHQLCQQQDIALVF